MSKFWGLVESVQRVLTQRRGSATRPTITSAPPFAQIAQLEPPTTYRPLENLVLTDGVSRTLFDEYAQHRASDRGEEETGWLLLGLRTEKEAVALATLPAGAKREAGVAHVRFNVEAQALACRVLQREQPRLVSLGVVHTHPGSLRHPSAGDLEGDREWVKLVRGGEGVFGIGTVEPETNGQLHLAATQPKPHVHCYQGLRFSWYALGVGEKSYRTMPVRLTIGPDLAYPLHGIWPILERHVEGLERLWKQLARLSFEVVSDASDEESAELHVIIPLEPKRSLRVVLRGEEVKYCLVYKDQWQESSSREPCIDRGVYLALAELAKTGA